MKLRNIIPLFAVALLFTGCATHTADTNEKPNSRAINGMMKTNWDMGVNQGQSATAESDLSRR